MRAIPILAFAMAMLACKKDEEPRSVEYRASCYSCVLSYKNGSDYARNVVLDTAWTDGGYRPATWSTTVELRGSQEARIILMNDGIADSLRHDTCTADILVDGATVRSQRMTSIGGTIDLSY